MKKKQIPKYVKTRVGRYFVEWLRFFCPNYTRVGIPRLSSKYMRGNSTCSKCVKFSDGIIWHANFRCEPDYAPGCTRSQLASLFRWFNDEIKRSGTQGKVARKSKKNDDRNKADRGKTPGIGTENPKPETERRDEEKIAAGDPTDNSGAIGRLQRMPEIPVRYHPAGVRRTEPPQPLFAVRAKSSLPSYRGANVEVLPGMQGAIREGTEAGDQNPGTESGTGSGTEPGTESGKTSTSRDEHP